ncbi:MAG TPA: class I SAM-dependent methyltransferase [Anaerolineales bacterium]|nr:class I SAM-dependent methyltransferase [Anaerolineales bacterium]
MDISAPFSLLESHDWRDYELQDSGNGLKLERFGPYVFIRPETQAIWRPALPEKSWASADAIFQSTGEESGGHWILKKKIPPRWEMKYGSMRFWAMTTPGRHLGVFPETAPHWDFIADSVRKAGRTVKVLNLFGYTGLASLAAAAAGAQVTHVDASRKSVAWARENQSLSGLNERPIRWIVDDALKFVQRESRRGARYEGLILDPPKFGRGPKGEVWEVYKSLPNLFESCQALLSEQALFVIITVYAVRASALHLGQALQDLLADRQGRVASGELVTREKSAGRLLSQAVFARWSGGSS